jgi:coatomer subunit beta
MLLKVSVNTTLCNLTDYLASLLKNTNMKCLTPDKALSGECGFMAANLYAKVFIIVVAMLSLFFLRSF